MNKIFNKRLFGKKGKKGFTLVELLVVIAILALLALIAVPRLGMYRKDAAEAANQASAASIYNGAQAYLAKHGNLIGYNWEDYITGALPSDAVVIEPVEDADGGVTAAQVTTNNGLWVGKFPEDGELGGGGTTPTTPTVTLKTTPAVNGDLLVHVVTTRTNNDTVGANPVPTLSTPGWTLRASSGFMSSGTDRRWIYIFTKIADGNDTPGTVTWTNGGTTAASFTRIFTGANNYNYVSNGIGNNGASGGTAIAISGSASQGQLVFAAVGYRDTVTINSITPLGGFTSNAVMGGMSSASAWAQAGEGGVSGIVANSASGLGVGAMVVFTVSN